MPRFRLPKPRSITSLVLLGFALVVLPLIVAVVWALLQLDELATRSETLVVEGLKATQNSRRLSEQLSNMDRLVRQYQLSEDTELLEFLDEDRKRAVTAIVALREGTNVQAQQVLLNRIYTRMDAMVRSAGREPPGSEAALAEISRFASAIRDADELQTLLNDSIDTQLNRMQEDAERTKATLAWQAFWLAVVGGIAILFVTWRVGKPIRALDRAISQLGQGGFSRAISVQGPADLEALGHQLEWLRGRLLELAQEKNRFLRHMSHELKTPLANIREGTELLLDGSVGELASDQAEVTEILRGNGIKLQRLIENLLNFSAWQTRSEVLNYSDFPLRDLVRSVLKGHLLPMKAQQVTLCADVQSTFVYADREMLRTVLDNLISNAVKYSPRNGALLVRAYRSESELVIEVADQGPGIPMSERKRVFDAFYQGTQSHDGLVGGTGIGLSVVMESVQAHDGMVDITDERQSITMQDGQTHVFTGAHFRVIIPQQEAGANNRKAANA